MKQTLCVLAVLIFCHISAFSQVSYYADSFKGGVTGGGYGPAFSGGGTGVITVYIDPGSTIRKAFLFAGREGVVDTAVTVTLNGIPLTFDSTNQVSPTFQSPDYGGSSAVHAIDVTTVVIASINNYTLVVPDHTTGANNHYNDFYLFIAYDNPSLTTINTEVFLNNYDFAPLVNYTFDLTRPVNSINDLGVGLFMGYMCYLGDDDSVLLNGNFLGRIWGAELNSGTCAGPYANFYYSNDTLGALSGNNADQAMNSTDVLSNAKAIIPNNSTSFTMQFRHPNYDDAHWGFFVVSGGSCSPPVATAGPDTALCYGSYAQLNANGGTTYQWSPGTGLSDSSVSNPVVVPFVSGTYTVTVSNGCGSSATTVSVIVYPSPPTPVINQSGSSSVPDTLSCPTNPGYVSYQWYYNSAPIANATDTMYLATVSGNYNVAVTDSNGCNIAVGINVIITGIPPLSSEDKSGLVLYPNPATNQLTVIATSLSEQSLTLAIFNILGQKVYSQSEIAHPKSEIQIDVSTLPNGMYFIQFTSNQATDNKRWVGKFVKK